ncbi:GHMP kinase N-terminal domain [Trinorchestia longiramus]|nr:GHMP kinase N-terminal domain [Trinorchestia longiramus]
MGPVTCVLLVAGQASRLALDVERDASGCYTSLQGIPKALLPGPRNIRILDHWWQALKQCSGISQVLLVTNADKYKHFERWASAADFPLSNIINDGSTLPSNALGAAGDLELVVRTRLLLHSDVLVIAGDMMYQTGKFKIEDVLNFWQDHPEGDVAVCYSIQSSELTTCRGILEIDECSKRVKKFLEKPLPSATDSRLGSVVFYGLRSSTLQLLQPYLRDCVSRSHRSMGCFIAHIINLQKRPVYGCLVQSDFQLIGDVSLQDYMSWLELYSTDVPRRKPSSPGFKARAFARFGSLNDLYGISSREGYLGGLRLLQATCKMFLHYCTQHRIELSGRNFTLSYDTNIPRQVGLAGSSAIVTATLHALMAFYGITDQQLPQLQRPQLILDVERHELNINAGLQDRVVQVGCRWGAGCGAGGVLVPGWGAGSWWWCRQDAGSSLWCRLYAISWLRCWVVVLVFVYQGLVYMDFSRELLERDHHGRYEHISLHEDVQLPSFFLAYRPDPSDSGRIHSDVRDRFDRGDVAVVEGMTELASLTDVALTAILKSDAHKLGSLMRQNFKIRERLYGRQCLGEQNLRMVELGEDGGAAVKFPGSGGAVLGLIFPHTDMELLRGRYQSEGCVVVDVIPQLDRKRILLSL